MIIALKGYHFYRYYHLVRPRTRSINKKDSRLPTQPAIIFQSYKTDPSPPVTQKCQKEPPPMTLPRSIRPILSLKNSRSLIHLNRVPSSPRHLDTKHAVSGANPKPGGLHELSLVRSSLSIMHRTTCIHTSHLLIEHPIRTPLQANHRLAGLEVPMNRHTRTHLQSIQHPLAAILRRCP